MAMNRFAILLFNKIFWIALFLHNMFLLLHLTWFRIHMWGVQTLMNCMSRLWMV